MLDVSGYEYLACDLSNEISATMTTLTERIIGLGEGLAGPACWDDMAFFAMKLMIALRWELRTFFSQQHESEMESPGSRIHPKIHPCDLY